MLMQKPKDFDPSQFFQKFKQNQVGMGAVQEENKSSFIRDHGVSAKPLGLNTNKVLAALKNLKNSSMIPKGGQGNENNTF